MKFWIEKVLLWNDKRKIRELSFKNNKVNVITGDSHTGKTAILDIYDYCFFASRSKIPENTINENVGWYGILFHINEKTFVICRSALVGGKVSDEFYFSGSGNVPEYPEATHEANTLRTIIETEFSIDRRVSIPYGGGALKIGSKISLRYFQLFTTISEDIITSSGIFFDKQDQPRYVDALPRIFDLAVGIETVENVIAKEESARINSELRRLKRNLSRLEKGSNDFQKETNAIVRRARKYGLLDKDAEPAEALVELRKIASDPNTFPTDKSLVRESKIRKEIAYKTRIIRNLRHLQSEYDDYRKILQNVEDSLRPISILTDANSEIVETSIFGDLVAMLEKDLDEIREDIGSHAPISSNISDLIATYGDAVTRLKEQVASMPRKAAAFQSERERFLFVGEIRAKMELYGSADIAGDSETILKKIEKAEKSLSALSIFDSEEKRNAFVDLLEELIRDYMKLSSGALGNYDSYLPAFDYKSKKLHLRKPRTTFNENIGSSSNHMFLHLFLFFALHEAIGIQRSPFVPSFLIIDQPSRPYWGEGKKRRKKLNDSDEAKIRKAFEVMDAFVSRSKSAGTGQCQVLVFEHVPEETWSGLENVHLVEKFTEGNALILSSEVD